MFKTIVIIMLTGLLFFGLAAEDAAEGDQESIVTETVEVVGDVPVAKTIQSVSIYKNQDIEKFNFESVKSVLQMTPGLLSLSTGQFGQSTSTSIRGSKSTQVLYVVDGVKLRDGASIGGVNLAVISPNIIDKIEVVRGPLSNIYGSDAMGGVVSMNTYSKEGAVFSASLGSHGSYQGNFSGVTKANNFTLGLAVNNQRYTDDFQNDEFKNTGLSAKVNYNTENLDTGLRFFGNFSDSGIPFNTGMATPNRTYKRNYFIAALPLKYTFNENSKLNLSLAYTKSKYEFEDPGDQYNSYFHSNFNNYEAELIYSARLMEKLNLRAGVDYSNQTILNEDLYGKSLDDVKRHYFSGFLSTGLSLDALQLSASVRIDKYKDVDANVSPQIGLSYLINHKLKLRAAYSHSFMAPMISQQVNPWGSPNFDLKPEKGKSFEIGAEYYAEKFTLSATYFNTRYEDMIDWVTIDYTTFLGQYHNIKNVDTSGIELSATIRPINAINLTGSYSYLDTEDKETGEPLIRKPKHTFSGFVSYTHKRFTLTMNAVYVGKRPDLDYSNWMNPNVESPAFNTYGFSILVPVTKNFTIFGKLTNAFDKEYQEVVGYPTPGRRFELGLKYKVM